MIVMVEKGSRKKVVYMGLSEKGDPKTATVFDGEKYKDVPLTDLELTTKDYNSVFSEQPGTYSIRKRNPTGGTQRGVKENN